MTYRDLIQASLQDLQILGAGDVMSADDAQLGIDRLNDWIDGLALEGLTLPQLVGRVWPLVPGLDRYVVGTGVLPPGLDMAKPVSPQAIANIGYFDAAVTPPTYILFGGVLTDQTQVAATQPTSTAAVPTGFWYDPTSGLTGTLYVSPIPTSATLRGVIYAPGQFTLVQLTDLVALPAGYRRFFRSNLSVELASAFEHPVPPSIAHIASESMTRVKTANLRVADLSYDVLTPGVRPGRAYDIGTDT